MGTFITSNHIIHILKMSIAQLGSTTAVNTRSLAGKNFIGSKVSSVTNGSKGQMSRWKGMDEDISDDQQDISRGRDMVDSKFQGGYGMGGTHNAVMSSTDYISQGQKNLDNLSVDGNNYYISPSFLDKTAVHVAKNFMDLPKIKVPLILGVWGGKGQGKTFQTHLAFQKLGVNPIVMSAGELESGNAGEPAKLVRQRYREASDVINQMVNATLMNIADNPTNVQLPGTYNNEEIPRVPIICTGNDFSTLYAPLIRDGRMEKFYWNPTREDRIGICGGIFKEDDVGEAAIEKLVDSFPNQSIDFFGALRARIYDDKVRDFIADTGLEGLSKRLVNSREGPPKFETPQMDVDTLMKYGNLLVEEQENVKRVQLADAYLDGAELAGVGGSSLPEEVQG